MLVGCSLFVLYHTVTCVLPSHWGFLLQHTGFPDLPILFVWDEGMFSVYVCMHMTGRKSLAGQLWQCHSHSVKLSYYWPCVFFWFATIKFECFTLKKKSLQWHFDFMPLPFTDMDAKLIWWMTIDSTKFRGIYNLSFLISCLASLGATWLHPSFPCIRTLDKSTPWLYLFLLLWDGIPLAHPPCRVPFVHMEMWG